MRQGPRPCHYPILCWLPFVPRADQLRTAHTRVAAIPRPVVEEETMDAPWRGLSAQVSTIIPCRAREEHGMMDRKPSSLPSHRDTPATLASQGAAPLPATADRLRFPANLVSDES